MLTCEQLTPQNFQPQMFSLTQKKNSNQKTILLAKFFKPQKFK